MQEFDQNRCDAFDGSFTVNANLKKQIMEMHGEVKGYGMKKRKGIVHHPGIIFLTKALRYDQGVPQNLYPKVFF